MKNTNSGTGSRKYITVLAMFLAMFSLNLQAKDRTLSNGFSMNANLGFVNSDFGTPALISHDEFDFATMWGFQIGNRWYFSPTETWGFGLMVNWFDLSFVGATSNGDDLVAIADMAAFELGPVFTYAITDGMALDAYYNLRPTYMIAATTDGTGLINSANAYGGFGFTHALGLAYRWKVLWVGIESVFGSISPSISGFEDMDIEDAYNDLSDSEQIIDSKRFQIILGVKF